jgi:hypothetical protein
LFFAGSFLLAKGLLPALACKYANSKKPAGTGFLLALKLNKMDMAKKKIKNNHI